jgi:hypothetical protein
MAKMLPEFWPVLKPEAGESKKLGARKLRPVTDLSMWLQCFAIYCGTSGIQDPEATPELMA